jgi:predicted DNA-binding transcriptional regulator AlpA
MNPNEVMLTAKQVRTRYGGVSDMALWRWLRDERLAFPQPIVINSRRYWRLSDLAQWELTQAGRKVA